MNTRPVKRCAMNVIDCRITNLRQIITDLRQDITDLAPHPIDGNYTFLQWITRLISHLGYVKGVQQDYATGSQHDGNTVRPVSIQDIYKWHAANKVPDWAFNQIDLITYPTHGGTGEGVTRSSHKEWSTVEVTWFVNLALENPKMHYKEIASLCSKEFGRTISENAVRGMFTRRRDDGRLPPRR